MATEVDVAQVADFVAGRGVHLCRRNAGSTRVTLELTAATADIEVGTSNVGASEIGILQRRCAEVSICEIRVFEGRAGQVGNVQCRPSYFAIRKVSIRQPSPMEARVGEVGLAEILRWRDWRPQTRAGEVLTGEVCPDRKLTSKLMPVKSWAW